MSIFTAPKPPYKDLIEHRKDKMYPSMATTERSICTPSGKEVGPQGFNGYQPEGRGTRSIMPRSQRKML